MKVRIIQEFRDRVDFTKVYPIGETFTFDAERAANLIARGLAEEVKEVAAVKPKADDAVKSEEKPSESVVSKVQRLFIREAEETPTTTRKKRATKEN